MAILETPETLQVEIPTAIRLTPAAVQRVRNLLRERNAPDHALRVFVAGGGCSGMQYGMALEGQARESDASFEADGVRVVIDPTSMGYLAGATIDYMDDIMGGGFRIENPNASVSCRCGHSFRTPSGSKAAAEAEASSHQCGCGH